MSKRMNEKMFTQLAQQGALVCERDGKFLVTWPTSDGRRLGVQFDDEKTAMGFYTDFRRGDLEFRSIDASP